MANGLRTYEGCDGTHSVNTFGTRLGGRKNEGHTPKIIRTQLGHDHFFGTHLGLRRDTVYLLRKVEGHGLIGKIGSGTCSYRKVILGNLPLYATFDEKSSKFLHGTNIFFREPREPQGNNIIWYDMTLVIENE